MRPHLLTPLFAAVSNLGGVGSRIEALLTKLLLHGETEGPPKVADLLFHFPTGLIDRSFRPKITEARRGHIATIAVTIVAHKPPPPRQKRIPYRIHCEDETGSIALVFFHGDKSYLEKQFPVGEKRIVSGQVDDYGGALQMPHPDYAVKEDEIDSLPLLEPVYALTAGLSGKVLRRAVAQAVERVPQLAEWQDAAWRERQRWPGFRDALTRIHNPQGESGIVHSAAERQRIAYDELLANQLALALVRRRLRVVKGRAIKGSGELRQKIMEALPFELTGAQREALAEIDAGMGRGERMLRLLQGDVGSGKTIVALLAMAGAVEAGCQAALMAPTEVLARQHYKTLAPLAGTAGIRLGLLTGREKGKERERLLGALEDGEIDVIVGTHALFQEGVTLKDLGLAVVDEQHRFGVHQRLALQAKSGGGADMLVMTATPIPRTLLMTHYGDMDVSQLREKPAGRQPVATRAMPVERIGEVVQRLSDAIAGGAQVYWVCPLVEESDAIDAAAAEARYEHLKQRFGGRVALVHGRMAGAEKDAAMAAFAAGETAILVATTVIEVGVDVPNATIMVIEHSERFGLAQLHQLRGRVGRGTGRSSCILLYQGPLTGNARARLKVLRESEDGFRIAEEDLKLRGGGELLGTRQSGMPSFRAAELPKDEALLAAARDDARVILSKDPELKSDRGEALRTLLYLFGRDEAVRLLRAG